MVDFRPFRAVRYSEAAGPLDDLVCPPYDVISPAAERDLLDSSPHNMVRMELAELDGPPPSDRYENAGLGPEIRSGAISGAEAERRVRDPDAPKPPSQVQNLKMQLEAQALVA